jgi:single-strand DNA-binding protein
MPFTRQSIELVGNLGKPAEMRFTPQGQPVTQFSMAVTRQWEVNGEKFKETAWFSVTTWAKLAEACANLGKGQQVLVKGYFKPDPSTGGPRLWNRQDGTAGANYELTASEVWLSPLSRGTAHGEPPGELYGAPEDEIPF